MAETPERCPTCNSPGEADIYCDNPWHDAPPQPAAYAQTFEYKQPAPQPTHPLCPRCGYMYDEVCTKCGYTSPSMVQPAPGGFEDRLMELLGTKPGENYKEIQAVRAAHAEEVERAEKRGADDPTLHFHYACHMEALAAFDRGRAAGVAEGRRAAFGETAEHTKYMGLERIREWLSARAGEESRG